MAAEFPDNCTKIGFAVIYILYMIELIRLSLSTTLIFNAIRTELLRRTSKGFLEYQAQDVITLTLFSISSPHALPSTLPSRFLTVSISSVVDAPCMCLQSPNFHLWNAVLPNFRAFYHQCCCVFRRVRESESVYLSSTDMQFQVMYVSSCNGPSKNPLWYMSCHG